MSLYATAILIALLCALVVGKPSLFVWPIMLGNFAASRLLEIDPTQVAIVDLAAAAGLASFGGRREATVAVIFVAMASLELIAHRLNVQTALIYIGTELMAFLQCGVIGGSDRGLGRLYRSIRGRWANRAYRPAAQFVARLSGRLARIVETDGRR